MASLALGDMNCHLALQECILAKCTFTFFWQAWDLQHWWTRFVGFDEVMPLDPPSFCLASPALGDMNCQLPWQGWHLLGLDVYFASKPGTHSTRLDPLACLVAACFSSLGVAGVAFGDMLLAQHN